MIPGPLILDGGPLDSMSNDNCCSRYSRLLINDNSVRDTGGEVGSLDEISLLGCNLNHQKSLESNNVSNYQNNLSHRRPEMVPKWRLFKRS